MDLKNTIIWDINDVPEGDIKEYIHNFCTESKIIYSNIIITDTDISFDVYSNISYKDLTVELIREKYSINDELKLHREEKENPNNEEYLEYVRYVKECKSKAQQFVAERDITITDI